MIFKYKQKNIENDTLKENEIKAIDEKIKWYNREWLYFSLSPLLTIIMLNIIMGADFIKGLAENNFFTFIAKTVITYAFILSLEYFLSKIFTKKIIAVYVVNIFLFILGTATTICISMTGDPIMPSDFFMVNKVGRIVGFIKIKIGVDMISSFLLLALILFAYTFLNKKFVIKQKQNIKQKVFFGILSLIIISLFIYLLGFNSYVAKNVLKPLKITVSRDTPKKDYENNGMVLFFLTHLSDLRIAVPEGYSSHSINSILNKYDLSNDKFNEYVTKENVNIIAIQSETFWDVTRLPDTKYTVDPLQHIHRMSESFPSGYVVTPVLGCNTCMPEFEFLTGTSVTLMQTGSYPYVQYVTHDIDAMPRVFAENGYATRAIHTYDKNYYSRDKAYKYIQYISDKY